jgi:hypothetical protein
MARQHIRSYDFEYGGLYFSITVECIDRKYVIEWFCPICHCKDDDSSLYDWPEQAKMMAEGEIRTHVARKHPERLPHEGTTGGKEAGAGG